jgi:cation diffusion facilitator family transporter
MSGSERPALPIGAADCPHEEAARSRHGVRERLRVRSAAVRRVFWVTLGLNLLVAAAKGVYGWRTGSITLGADALHSLLDGVANGVALLGMHFGAAPADAGHPYGHRKFEVLAAVGIGVLIALGLSEVAKAAVLALLGRRPAPEVGWPGFAVVLATMAVNLAVSRYESRKARELGSALLEADAGHTRSDFYASSAVLVSFLGARTGLRWADGACGLLIVFLVGRVAWQVLRSNLPALLDAATIDPDDVLRIALKIEGVKHVHKVRSRGSPIAVELDLHLEVDPRTTVQDAHALAHRVEDELRQELKSVLDVVVHVEPAVTGDGAASSPPSRTPPGSA